MIGDFRSKVFKVSNIYYTCDKPSAFAMKSDTDNAVTSSGIAAGNVDLCSAAELTRAALCLLTTLATWTLPFYVGNNAPDTFLVFARVFAHE